MRACPYIWELARIGVVRAVLDGPYRVDRNALYSYGFTKTSLQGDPREVWHLGTVSIAFQGKP